MRTPGAAVRARWAHNGRDRNDPIFDAWQDAGRLAGWPVIDDYNGPEAVGFARVQFTIRNGRRASASAAYLKPVLHRPGLSLLTGAMVTGVTMRGTHVSGVEFVHQGVSKRAEAAREVILCGGAFNSPQLLMLSGIGPAEHLRDLGIRPLVDLPVGRNLQDHLMVGLQWLRKDTSPFYREMRLDRVAINVARALLFGTGPATSLPLGLMAFLKTSPDMDVPDIEFIFRTAPLNAGPWFPGVKSAYQDQYVVAPVLLHPKSRGDVSLHSTDPFAPVRIRCNFLADPEDIKTLRDAFRSARNLAYRTPLDPFRGREVSPGQEINTDADVDAWILEHRGHGQPSAWDLRDGAGPGRSVILCPHPRTPARNPSAVRSHSIATPPAAGTAQAGSSARSRTPPTGTPLRACDVSASFGASIHASYAASSFGSSGQPNHAFGAIAAQRVRQHRIDELRTRRAGGEDRPAALVHRLLAGAALHDRAPIHHLLVDVQPDLAE